MTTLTVTNTIVAQQELSRRLARKGKTIAIVPTMGALHEGHLSLIRRGLKKADIVVTTIFVNPAQFAPNEDLNRYPRDPQGDLNKIKQAGGQVVFVPSAVEMYPEGFETYVTVENLTQTLEGGVRPTHFRGVTTVVAKLFNIVRPDVALFGMKDYQQAMVLKRMTIDLNWPIDFVICPTVREKDGLALSSRNRFLSPESRQQAPALYLALRAARQLVREGKTDAAGIENAMRAIIGQDAPSAIIDYIAFTEMETLRPVSIIGKQTVASLAARFGTVRLIDNLKIA
jgi:pantoate--beta-alanine ligase